MTTFSEKILERKWANFELQMSSKLSHWARKEVLLWHIIQSRSTLRLGRFDFTKFFGKSCFSWTTFHSLLNGTIEMSHIQPCRNHGGFKDYLGHVYQNCCWSQNKLWNATLTLESMTFFRFVTKLVWKSIIDKWYLTPNFRVPVIPTEWTKCFEIKATQTI